MNLAVMIVAAGRGQRMGSEIPKQYIPLGSKTALRRSAEVFLSRDDLCQLVPVIHPSDAGLCADALSGLTDPRVLDPVAGAETRGLSVRRGLEALVPHAPDVVLIHDAARPFVPPDVIERVVAALTSSPGACAALRVVDALWMEDDDGHASHVVPRDGLWRAQTPQGFHFDAIMTAHHAHDGTAADDVAVAREAGLAVALVEGSERSYKITTQPDLLRALADAKALDETAADRLP